VTNLGGRKHVLLCERGRDHAKGFWWYPNGNTERVYEISRMDEHIVDLSLVHSSPGMGSAIGSGGKSSAYLLESQIGRSVLAGEMSVDGVDINKASTNMMDTTRSCKTRSSCLMVNSPPGRASPISVVIEGGGLEDIKEKPASGGSLLVSAQARIGGV
jgi:hypothetical protein